MTYVTCQPATEKNLGDTTGLSQDQQQPRTGYQNVDCPGCDIEVRFDAELFVWRNIGRFEVTDAICPECGGKFELTAAPRKGNAYDFFGTDYTEDPNA